MLTDVKHCLKTCEQPLIRHSQSSFNFLHHQRQRNANRCQALTENMWTTFNPTYPILFQIFLSLSTNVKHWVRTSEQLLIRYFQSSFNFLHHPTQHNANRFQAWTENLWTTVNPTYPILFQFFASSYST